MSTTNADQVLRYKGFSVEIDAANAPADADADWVTLSGGQLLEGKDKGRYVPGQPIVNEVTLRGPLTPGRKAMTRWLNDTLGGGPLLRTVTVRLTPLDPKQPLEVLVFEEAYVTGYVFPPLALDDPCSLEPIEELRFAYARLLRP